MRLQAPRLAAREAAIEAAKNCLLRLVAGGPTLEVLGERSAGAEYQPLERALTHVHDLPDLSVRAALELPHDERLALRGREVLKRPKNIGKTRLGALLGRMG